MDRERPSPLVRTAETRVWWLTVEQGANLLRSATPLKHFDDYISGFRPARDEPSVQMEVAHQEVQPLTMLSGQERERWRADQRALRKPVKLRA